MSEDTGIDRRLDRIDNQLEKMEAVVTEVVRLEERISAVLTNFSRLDHRLDEHAKRLTSLDERVRKTEAGGVFTAGLQRFLWLVAGAVVTAGIAFSMKS